MTSPSKLIAILSIAGGIGMAGLGISHAQSATTTTAATNSATTTTTSTAPPMGHGQHGEHLDELATSFGMTTTELQTALNSGKELYQIAAEHGVTYAKQKATQLSELKTKLDDMVKVGYMTQAEADSVYANAQTSPMMGLGMGGPHGRM